MRLVSFRTADGPAWGKATDDGIVPAPKALLARLPTLRAAIAADALGEIAACREPAIPFDAVVLLPPIPDPEKIVCIGKNYSAHAAESGDRPPERPSLFIRLANTLVPHGGALVRPKLSADFDYEGELAIVIGRGGRHIAARDALAHVAGYACFNDGSVRDYQFKHSLAAGKNFFATGGFGPWLTTADAVPDPLALTIETRLNGAVMQHASTAGMVFGPAEIIAYISAFTPLAPGDVIATGTPEGVAFARMPPPWLAPGDVVEVEISGVGLLRNTVAAEDG